MKLGCSRFAKPSVRWPTARRERDVEDCLHLDGSVPRRFDFPFFSCATYPAALWMTR
jgi:hypothetical protein